MKITNLKIDDQYNILFNHNFYQHTLIWSTDNSHGKTTLIRFILYALGFDVPPTKKINMYKYKTTMEVDNPKRIITRYNNIIKISCPNEKTEKEFDLDKNEIEAHAFLFGLNNYRVINNLLGTFYIDQEKGWTLLNRGKVIASRIGFNIEDFIIGLTNKDTSKYDAQIAKIQSEIDRYSAILNIVLLNEEQKSGYREEEQITDLKCKKSNLISSINELEQQKKELAQIVENNEKLVNIIESYDLMIRVPNLKTPIRVTKDNIVDFGINQFILKSQINEIDISISKLKNNLENINSQLNEYFALFEIEDVSKDVINQVKQINLSQVQLENLIDGLKKERRSIENSRNQLMQSDYKIKTRLASKIEEYSKKLNVFDGYVGKEKDYLLTRNLKEYSGALYHKVTLCYRLAYYDAIKTFIGLELPFIIDSPGSAEVKADRLSEMMNLVFDTISEQVIVSSVYDKELNISESNKIILNNGIFGDNNL